MVFTGTFSVQFGAAFSAHLFPRVGALGAVTVRLAVAALVLGIVVRPRLRGYTRADLALALAFGLVLAAMNSFFYEAIARLPIGIAVTFEFLGPLTVALVASRRLRDLLWVGCAGLGVALIGGGVTRGLDPVGVAFAVAAAACWATYILVAAQTGKRFAKTDGLAIAMAIGAVVMLPVGASSAGATLLQPAVLGIGGAVALMSSVVPYTLEMFALRRITPGTFGVLMSLEPAVAAFAGAVVLGQRLDARELFAIGLVVVASVGVTWQAARGRRRGQQEPPEVTANKYNG